MKSISFIIPIYNTEKYLKRCLNSIIENNYENYEIIAIDDGSNDSTKDILKEYTQTNNNIRSYFKNNTGQGDTRNIGLNYAKNDYIWFVDSDDYIKKHSLSEIMPTIEKENSDIMIFDSIEIKGNSHRYMKGLFDLSESIQKNYIISPAGPCNKIFKREFLQRNSFQFLKGYVQEDLASIPALGILTDKIKYLPKPFYYYEILEGSTMRQLEYSKKLEDIFPAMENLAKLFGLNDTNGEYNSELEYVYIENMIHSATLRFLNYPEGLVQIEKIIKIIKERYPKWFKNKYFKKENIKYKLMCYLTMNKRINILKYFINRRKKS